MSKFENVTKFAVLLATAVETELNSKLESQGYATKGDVTKSVSQSTGQNPGCVGAVLDAYLTDRDDLESRAGRSGGIYKKGEAKPLSPEEQNIHEVANAVLATKADDQQMTTQMLSEQVASTTGLDQNKVLHAVRRFLDNSSEWELVKRVGIRRVKTAAPTTDATAN